MNAISCYLLILLCGLVALPASAQSGHHFDVDDEESQEKDSHEKREADRQAELIEELVKQRLKEMEEEADKKAEKRIANARRDTYADLYEKSEIQPALVLIEGGNGSGTGFICEINGIPFLVTNIHVLASADPSRGFGNALNKLEAHTLDGKKLTLISIYGAADHDLAIIRFQEEAAYKDVALTFDTNVGGTVQEQDPIVIPGNSKGAGTMVWTHGEVVGVGPVKVEHNAPIYKGNSGSPIVHIPSGKVIGILSYMQIVPIESFADSESFNDKNSAIKNKVRYFGYRLDSAKEWYPIDLAKFCQQFAQMEAFIAQREHIAQFLYTNSKDWRNDPELDQMFEDVIEQAKRKVVSGRIGQEAINRANITISRKLHTVIKNDVYRNYTAHMNDIDYRGSSQSGIYPFFNEQIAREVKIRDYLSENVDEWESDLRGY